jgi:hypothetical protein
MRFVVAAAAGLAVSARPEIANAPAATPAISDLETRLNGVLKGFLLVDG